MSSTHEELELVKQNAIEKHSNKFDLLKSKNFKIDSNHRFFFNDDEERNVKANMKIEPIEFKGMISVGYPRPHLKLNVFLSIFIFPFQNENGIVSNISFRRI